jgi:hypothetical protein
MRFFAHTRNPGQNLVERGVLMNYKGKYGPRNNPRDQENGRYVSDRQWWWVVYYQDLRTPHLIKAAGSGAGYGLQTFLGTKKTVKSEFGQALVDCFDKRAPALELLQELNIIDSVQNS